MSDDDGFLKRLARRAVELKDRAIEYPSTVVPPASDEHKLRTAIAMAQARNRAEQFAAPKVLAMKQNVSQNLPGAQAAADAILRAARGAATRDVGELDEPTVRQPVQQERDFSNDQDREEYIARAREAMKKASSPRQ